jgi:hypothetical protein
VMACAGEACFGTFFFFVIDIHLDLTPVIIGVEVTLRLASV